MQIKFPTEEDVRADVAFVDKVLRFKVPMAFGLAIFIGVAVFVSGGGSRRMSRERDFFTLSHQLQQLVSGDEEFNESKLAKLLKAYPEVSSDFDYILRDVKLIEGNDKEAQHLGNKIIDRLSYLHPYYIEFMQVAQLIEQQRPVEASKNILILKHKIEEDGIEKFPNLYAFTLARYGYVQNLLGSSENQSKSREELRELIYGDESVLGAKAQKNIQKYVESDNYFFSKFFD